MDIRVDFLDNNDLLCKTSYALRGYSPVHTGIRLYDYYLLPPLYGECRWIPVKYSTRLISGYLHSSYYLYPQHLDPVLVSLIPDGQVVSSPMRLWLTEWVHWGAEMGLWSWRPSRTSCGGIISDMVRAMGYRTNASSAWGLKKDLDAMWLSGIVAKEIHEPKDTYSAARSGG